jgi:ABC-2 type transport system permease protein
VLTIGFPILASGVISAHWGQRSPADRAHFNPLDVALIGSQVSRAVVGAALYLTVIAIFSLSLGTILRNTAGGIAAFAAILFVIPPLMNVLPTSWDDAASRYLPSNASRAILSVTHDSGSLAPWTGFAVLCAYTAAALAVAAVLLVRRDA